MTKCLNLITREVWCLSGRRLHRSKDRCCRSCHRMVIRSSLGARASSTTTREGTPQRATLNILMRSTMKIPTCLLYVSKTNVVITLQFVYHQKMVHFDLHHHANEKRYAPHVERRIPMLIDQPESTEVKSWDVEGPILGTNMRKLHPMEEEGLWREFEPT